MSSCLAVSNVKASNGGELIWAQTENPGTYDHDIPYGVAVDGSGLYVVGYDTSAPPNYHEEWRVEKRSPTDGSIVWVKIDDSVYQENRARGVAVDTTGVYIVGHRGLESEAMRGLRYWKIEKRSLTDGSLKWTQTGNSDGHEWTGYRGVAVDSSGVYVVGSNLVFGCVEWRIEKRSLVDGSIIWSTTSSPSSPNCSREPWGIAVDGSGVYVAGTDDAQGPGDSEWRIEKRRLVDGSLIWTQVENPSSMTDEIRGIAVRDSGLYVVGAERESRGQRIEKRNATDGSLIWTRTVNLGIGDSVASAVAVDAYAVYTAGYDQLDSPRCYEWILEARSPADGSLIWTQTEIPSGIPLADRAYGVAVDATGVYFVGDEHIPNFPGLVDWEWRIEKRGLGITTTTSTSTSVSTLTSTGTTSATQTQTSITSAATSTVSTATTTMSVIRGTIYWYDVYGNLCPVAWAQ
ncbi:MAG: hypothetical protein WCC94_04425, partial [Candidatus Bathyarchaeia archaeon]